MSATSTSGAIQWGSLGSFLLVAAAIMGSPGPTTVSLVGVASAFGPRRAIPYMVGEIVGTTVVLLAVATGITATLLAVPSLSAVLLGAAGLYILWLAYHIATAAPLSSPDEAEMVPSLAGGLFLGMANPKAWVALAAVFASTQLASSPIADAAAKLATLTGLIIVIHLAWLIAGAALGPLLRHPRRARAVNVTMATVLVLATVLPFLGRR